MVIPNNLTIGYMKEFNMYLIYSTIGNIQLAKATFLRTFVPDKKFRDPLQSIVDAQTVLTKEMVSAVSNQIDTCLKFFSNKND